MSLRVVITEQAEREMIHEKISAYFDNFAGYRYRSWEHCYRFFRDVKSSGMPAHRDHAALHLGFYLASWGMYRGPSFLLKHDYTVHLPVVDCLASSHFAPLWEHEFGSEADDVNLVPVIQEAAKAIKAAYSPVHVPTE